MNRPVRASCDTFLSAFDRRLDSEPVLTWVDDHGRDQSTSTVGALRTRAGAVAAALRAAGVEPGQPVALIYPPGPAFLDGFLGTLLAGAVPAPLYPPDPLRDDDRSGMLAHVAAHGARVALTDRSYNRIRRLGAIRNAFRRSGPKLTWIATDSLRPAVVEPHPARPDDVALLQFTSGSTAQPKGVEITHANLVHQLQMNREELGFERGSRAVLWVPQYHDLGLISGMLSAVFGNGRLWMMSPLSFLHRPALWMEVMHRVQATATAAPDFGYALVTRKTTAAQRARWDLSNLTMAMSAGEPVRPATRAAFEAAFVGSGFSPEAFCPAYGLAEHTVGATLWGGRAGSFSTEGMQARRLIDAAGDEATAVLSSGQPAPGVEVAIASLPGDAGPARRLADRQIGEIWLRSPSVAQGYRGLPDLSAERFAATLQGEDGTWLRTGDLGALWNGELVITGRLKDLILIGGRNVYPEDIEETVRQRGLAIRPGGIAAVGLSQHGTEALGLAVEVVKGTSDSQLAEIAHEIGLAVARHHRLRCAEVLLLPPGSLPKTTSGKMRRGAIRTGWAALTAQALRTTAPDVALPQAETAWTPGMLRDALASRQPDVVMAAVRALLAREANLPAHAIALDLPLTDQGFDSLRQVSVLSTIDTELGGERPPLNLAGGTTPTALARQLLAPPPEGRRVADAALAAPLDPDTPIAIVGAGPSGLTAALSLCALGYRSIDIFEASERLGGKVCSVPTPEGVYEAGQVVMSTSYTHTRGLAAALSADTAPHPTALGVIAGQGVEMTEDAVAKTIAWFDAVQSAWGDSKEDEKTVSIGAFLARHGLRAAPPLVAMLWTGCGYGHLSDGVSMDDFVAYFKITASGQTEHIVGGNSGLWERAAERLTAQGVRIHRQTPARLVTRSLRGCTLTVDRSDGSTERLTPGAVLLTVPPGVIQRLLSPADPLAALARRTVAYDYRVAVFRADPGVDPRQLLPDDPAPADPVTLIPAAQAPGIWLSYWFAATPYRPEVVSPEEHIARLRQRCAQAGMGEIAVVRHHAWPEYFPHVPAEQASTLHADVDRLQGADGLWALGSWVAGETVEQVVRHAQAIIQRDFAADGAAMPPPPPAAPSPVDGWPLTPSQQQFLGFQLLAPDEPMVTTVQRVVLTGWDDTEALTARIRSVLASTDDLRLTLMQDPSGPRVTLGAPGPLHCVDLRGHDTPQSLIQSFATRAARMPWTPLWGRPPVEVTLFTLDGGQHVLCLRCNHIFFDGPALGRLAQRFAHALRSGSVEPWPTSQPAALAGLTPREDAERFWRHLLKDVPADPDAPLPAMRPARYINLSVELSLGRRLLSAVSGSPLGLSALHIAAMALVEAARTGRDQVLLRVPVNLASTPTALGCNVLIVPVPVRIVADSVQALLRTVEATLVAVIRHARVSPALIDAATDHPLPMCPSVNTWSLQARPRFGDLQLHMEQIHSGRQADLFESIWVHERSGGRLEAWARYSTTHHTAEGVDRSHRAVLAAAEALISRDSVAIPDLLVSLRGVLR